MLLQPRHYLEEVNVKVSSIWRRPPRVSYYFTHIYDAPRHHTYLVIREGNCRFNPDSPAKLGSYKYRQTDLKVALLFLQKQGPTRIA